MGEKKADPPPANEPGPVKLSKGKIIGKRWKIRSKLGEGGCGAVYKVEDLQIAGSYAALKAESNFVAGGSVLKLEAQILRRLAGKRHVAQLFQSGKKEKYCYMVMTLMGDSLGNVVKKCGRTVGVSTQTRIGINVLYGVKQIHDVGFIHRDLKPANIALGRQGTKDAHFLHILDFGLAREYVMKDDEDNGKIKFRRERSKALFRGTTRYCSINTHERGDQSRGDDLWSLLYMLAELRASLPWGAARDKKEVAKIKKATEIDKLLENSPVELVRFAQHLDTLNYYTRPDYVYLHKLLMNIMEAGYFKFTEAYDWEKKGFSMSKEKSNDMKSAETTTGTGMTMSKELVNSNEMTMPLSVGDPLTGKATPKKEEEVDPENPFPAEFFTVNTLGF